MISSAFLAIGIATAKGEAMLELFNVNWNELAAKMPEIAEAGYDSLWLPPPEKGGSVYSIGYDVFDPFDLGDKNQRGTIPTKWGTRDELIHAVEIAHRFGIRVYFDNIMNHRAFDTPGYNSNTPTNLYPGLVPGDFHLQTVGQYFRNWPGVEDYNNQWDVQNESLGGLIDLATEPGSINDNFGPTPGSTIPKPVFVRQPNHPEFYMNTNLPAIAGAWHPFDGTNGTPVPEDVNAYLIRAAMWTLYVTKCDGFRLDAVKHVPSEFFGDSFDSPNGYDGGIQTMFDYIHGYGNNVIGNGYIEQDDNRNSVFDTEAPRNDAMLFGEHLGAPPSFQEYLSRGMRLLNAPLQSWMNNALAGNTSLSGMDGRDFAPNNGFSAAQGVQFAQSQDQVSCCATHRELQNAYYFMREGLPEIYSDGYNESTAPPGEFPFPNIAHANYLGEFGDNQMPEIAYLHHQLARGGTRSRWSDQNIVAFERYDYRDVASPANYANANTNADATVVLFAMNDNFNFPGDITFDDGIARTSDGFYGARPISNSRNLGLVVGFPPGTILTQLASSAPGADRAYPKLLVHEATGNFSAAQQSATHSDPVQRLIYIGGQTLAPGGGAIEFTIPSGGWVMYGLQWPEASRASLSGAISLRQGGAEVPRITVLRHDGANGDPNFNPIYPFKMRGSIDANGNVVGGINVSNRIYAIDIPVVTNADFDIQVRSDASTANTLVKLDGGMDINSQMNLGPENGSDLRDNKPGYVSDIFLGYEQAAFQFRNGPGTNFNIGPMPYSDVSKVSGLTQFAITNFNPETARVWIHNDLNPINTRTGLQSGFHILRARTFLPRDGKSAVFNTFAQTFYYSAGLPGGAIAFPTSDGSAISSGSYTVVVRADDSVANVDFNIQDSNSNNDDAVTGQKNGNGPTSFVGATQVTPDPALNAQFPNFPREFRFNYINVPDNGTATITVKLKDYAAGVYSNRVTTLTRTVETLAPAQVVHISNPAENGAVIPMTSNSVYLVQTCFTATLTTNDASLFSIFINGVLQPRASYIFRPPGSVSGCNGMRSLLYNWSGASAGTNIIQVVYSNGIVLSDTRTVIVPPPLRISSLGENNQLVVWDSAPGVNYTVLATTNLSQPFAPISPVVPGNGLSTYYFDPSPLAKQKFYRIKTAP